MLHPPVWSQCQVSSVRCLNSPRGKSELDGQPCPLPVREVPVFVNLITSYLYKASYHNSTNLDYFSTPAAVKSKMSDGEYQVFTRLEDITEQDDKNLAGAKKEIRNELTVIIPENPFPEIEVDAYPPLKFSWVIPKKLAAMAFPRNKENIKYLANQGITHLVTLTADKKPPVEGFSRIRWSEIPVEEFEVPSLEQIKKFIDICKKADKNGEVIGIHCRQGRSRSGIMLAAYLVHFHRFEPDQALNTIRMIRPGSCDSLEHEDAVGQYFVYLTEDNPLRFGVSGDVMEDFIQAAKEYNKNNIQ